MRSFNRLAAALVLGSAALLASCSTGAGIKGVVTGAPDSEIEVRRLAINRFEVLDTVKTDAGGRFAYKAAVAEGEPEFIYLFRSGVKIASLLLEKGDRVFVEADTLGHFTVEGSEESLLLAQVEKEYADFAVTLAGIVGRIEADPSDVSAQKDFNSAYIKYYRSRVAYVMTHPYSLTSVPVLYQKIAENFPVFSQSSDAMHFRSVADSLETVYPNSAYTKALRAEATRRMNALEIEQRISSAREMGYPEIELPDTRGQKIRLSDVEKKVTLVHFWLSTDVQQKMINLEVLKPLYERYASRGLEIYSVALDTDKAAWARVVKDQELGWVNVCDGLGAASPSAAAYNLGSVPATFVISDGAISADKISSSDDLARILSRLL